MSRALLLLAAICVAPLASAAPEAELARCVGAMPCKACKDCSACKYCHKDGGYCGVCSKPMPEGPGVRP